MTTITKSEIKVEKKIEEAKVPKTFKIIPPALRCFSEPNVCSNLVSVLSEGKIYNYTEERENWLHVEDGGWVKSNFVMKFDK